MQVTIKQAIPMIEACIKSKLVPLLKGSPGVGKSDIIWSIGRKYKLKPIDLRLSQCDPTDLLGFPNIHGAKATYIPMDTFPLDTDTVPEGFEGWVLFLDELTSAPPAIQAAAYKIILDRMVGNNKLHPKCVIVAAGNLMTDGAIVEDMSTALQSRIVHIELRIDNAQWLDWALEKGIDHRIMDFIAFAPDKIYTLDTKNTKDTYACPRTWEFADRFLKSTQDGDPLRMPLLSGTISEAVAREFLAFIEIYKDLPTIPQIIAGPTTIKVPTEAGTLYAMIGNLSHHMTDTNAEPLFQFIDRMPKEFQVVAVKESFRRNKNLMSLPAVQKWIATNSDSLF